MRDASGHDSRRCRALGGLASLADAFICSYEFTSLVRPQELGLLFILEGSLCCLLDQRAARWVTAVLFAAEGRGCGWYGRIQESTRRASPGCCCRGCEPLLSIGMK
jgi:hypothetical protein